jgi:hypothetical protein
MINNLNQIREELQKYFDSEIDETEKVLAITPPGEFPDIFSEYLVNLFFTFMDSSLYRQIHAKYQPYTLIEMMDMAVSRVKSRVFFYIDETHIIAEAPPVMPTDLLSEEDFNYITDIDDNMYYRDTFISPDSVDDSDLE